MAGCTRISIRCIAACPKKKADVCNPAKQIQSESNWETSNSVQATLHASLEYCRADTRLNQLHVLSDCKTSSRMSMRCMTACPKKKSHVCNPAKETQNECKCIRGIARQIPHAY